MEVEKGFRVGTTPGLYGVARAPELASALRKFGFGILKGVDFLESILDTPHEVGYTEGKVIRDMLKKEKVEIAIHGELGTPITMGEMEQLRLARDVIQRCARSAIYCGAKYLLFHASVWRWPETLTGPEVPVVWYMVDELGRPIRERLKEVEELREWFIQRYGEKYIGIILTEEERERLRREVAKRRMTAEIRLREKLERKEITVEEYAEAISKEEERAWKEISQDILREHLKKGLRWYREEAGNPVDIYRIMAQYLFITRDPILTEMYKMYEKELKEIGLPLDFAQKDWIDKLLTKLREERIKLCGEFYHAFVAGKYIEGHLRSLFDFIKKELIEKELKTYPPKEREALTKIAQNLKITLETPFLGGRYAGMLTLWHPRQVCAVVKALRKTLKTDRIFSTIDFEHFYVEGVDPWEEIPTFCKLVPDAGKYIISLHVTQPHPLHHHIEVEIGNEKVYQLLWWLRQAGLGKFHLVYLIFERGGEKEPYKRSITALKIMAKFLEKNIPPEKLKEHPEFFGISLKEIAAFERQLAVVREHAFEPLKLPPKKREG